jgi:hypothetical protein
MLRRGVRTFSRAAWLVAVLLQLLATPTLAQDLEVPADPRRLEPGAFGVATVTVRGSGSFVVEFQAPPGWSLVSGERPVDVDGLADVPVVLRVPRDASPNEVVQVGARLREQPSGAVIAEARIPVTVRAVRDIEIEVPRDVAWQQNKLQEVQIRLSNRANTEVAGRLVVNTPSFPVSIAPSQLVLAPGRSVTVTLSARPTGATIGQYTTRLVVEFLGPDDDEPIAAGNLFVTVRSGTGVPAAGERSEEPTLTFGLRTHANASVSLSSDASDWSVRYAIEPELRGALSDYVSVDASLPSLSGAPAPTFGPTFRSTFQGPSWDAIIQTDGRSFAGEYGRTFDDGRWSVQAGASARAASMGGSYRRLTDRVEWGLDAAAAVSADRHRERVAALARIRVSETVGIDLTVEGVGESLQEGGSYVVTPTASQALTWRTGNAYVQQSFGASPTVARYQGAVSAGYAGLGFSVRSRADLRYRSGTTSLLAGVRTTTRLPFRASLALDLDLSSADLSTGAYEMRGTASLAGAFQVSRGTSALWTLRYVRSQPLDAARLPGDEGSIALAIVRNDVDASLALTAARGPNDEGGLEARLGVDAELALLLSPTSTIQAEASWATRSIAGERDDDLGYGVRFRQVLSPTWRGELSYERADRWSAETVQKAESIGVTTHVESLFGVDLALEAGYRLAADRGLFEDAANLEHRLEISLAHTLELPFSTPGSVVDLFGGRVSGRVTGLLFIDENRDGTRQPEEPPLPSVAIALGESSFESDASGRFDARVPPGAYDFRFGRGLPALVGAVGLPSIDIDRDDTIDLEIAFAPVAFLEAFVVEAGANEPLSRDLPAVAGLRVILDGPIEIQGRSDVDGRIALSGLVSGTYEVAFDTTGLPESFVVTQPPGPVVVDRAGRLSPLLIGVAQRAPDIVRGFSAGDIAVRATASPRQAPPGADVEIEALTSGNPTTVRVELAGRSVQLHPEGDVWTGTVRLPLDVEEPVVQGTVIASRGDDERSARVVLRITDDPLAGFASTRFEVRSDAQVRVDTAFAAESVTVRTSEGTIVLSSEDGRRWSGSAALESPGTYLWTILADDVTVEEEVTVVEP